MSVRLDQLAKRLDLLLRAGLLLIEIVALTIREDDLTAREFKLKWHMDQARQTSTNCDVLLWRREQQQETAPTGPRQLTPQRTGRARLVV